MNKISYLTEKTKIIKPKYLFKNRAQVNRGINYSTSKRRDKNRYKLQKRELYT